MGIGDQISNMFLGSQAPEQSDASKQAQGELWKIYQQAYNVKPVWDSRKDQWVMPSGAIARFNMLLPILQAQASAARTGSAGAQGQGQGGVLSGLISSAPRGIIDAVSKEIGGWGGVGRAIKGLFGGGESYPTFAETGNTHQGLDSLESPPPLDLGSTGGGGPWDTGKFTPEDIQAGNNWDQAFIPGTSGTDFLNNFSPEDFAATGGNWGWLD